MRAGPDAMAVYWVLEHWHSGTMTRHSALDEAYPEARIEMQPADAEMHGITNNMPVRVT